jgi:phenylacetate-CoA ligase
MSGSGATTPTRRQVELIKAWKINVILGFPAYLRHMALVARDEMGIDVRTLGVRLIGTHLGREDRRQIEQLWDAPCFDMYGTHESGMMGAECQHQSGLHVQEDAFILEVADPDTGRILPDGEKGTLYITTLYKWGAPQIRFNVNDISAYATDPCACGSTMRRLQCIYGRADNMVKLRGVNVWPEAVGAIACAVPGSTPDYFVRALRQDGRDELVASIASDAEPTRWPGIRSGIESRLKEELGVRIRVELVLPGALDAWTGFGSTPKLKRFRDDRSVG